MLINIDPKVHQAYKKLACQQQTRHRNTTQSTNPTTKYTNGWAAHLQPPPSLPASPHALTTISTS